LVINALAAGCAGRREECLATVGRMVATRNECHVSACDIALGFVAAGELDQAEPWIERAAAEHSPWINFLKGNPGMSVLHDRPRIQAILACFGRGA
jgi:hypothetical protein